MGENYKTGVMDERQLRLSQETFGPYWMMHVLPWLLLATTMRFLSFYPNPIVAVIGTLIESVAIFLAFVTAARRAGDAGPLHLRLQVRGLRKQIDLAGDIVGRIYITLFAAAGFLYLNGREGVAFDLLRGLDGVAYDQSSWPVMVWSGALAALVMLMLLNAEKALRAGAKPFAELVRCTLWMAPGIAAIAIAYVAISYAEGASRGLVALVWNSALPQFFKNAAYFLFVFAFAALRLWVVTKILMTALALSQRVTSDRPDDAADPSR